MLTPDDFLADYESHFVWSLPDGGPGGLGLKPVAGFMGRGNHPLEVALGTVAKRPRADELRKAWGVRHGKAPNPLLLVGTYQENGGWKASICGPAGDEPPVEGDLELGEVERIAAAALAEPSRHAAIRFLSSIWSELEHELPGLRNQGMFATHELRDGVPTRSDWEESCVEGRKLAGFSGQHLVKQLGFSVDAHATTASVLTIAGTKRAVAVFLDEGEDFETGGNRFGGSSPISHALAVADQEGLPWVVLTRGRQIRVYAARTETGVGRKGRSETFVEANLALLPDDRVGYVQLLFSADALKERGTFEELLERSRDYSADLGTRLRDRVYAEAVPTLAIALARRHVEHLDDEALAHLYEQALTVLFRLLFVAYAEDKDLLPYRSNGAYREHALKALARELADRCASGPLVLDDNSTDLWDEVAALWLAVDKGNVERGVPPYDGGLFSSSTAVNPAGAAIAKIRLTNEEFGPAVVALLVDEADDGLIGPVDFRSLSVREFGTIYEGLLESRLSVAPTNLTLDRRNSYVPAQAGDDVFVRAGEVYFHDRSGARKASGSYFTKPFAVEHLLDHALEPALADHIRRIAGLIEAGEEAKAAQAFFDFGCVDVAMGSGHFLVAAVDRIEARLSAFLALNPIPQLTAELERLRKSALDALGPLGEGVEIEQASLLRRQVARRCVYGVDANPIAVELARLGIWIHTFVPGLPLSFLDHALVCGDSLMGVGTLDEAVQALDPEHVPGQASLFRDQILNVLGRAQNALQRLAQVSEASKSEIEEARAAQQDAEKAVEPARALFDLIIAHRIGAASPLHEFDQASIAANADLNTARELNKRLNTLHFPIAYPEVFLRDPPGFDCMIGNPPWEKLQVERHSFYALHFPGLRGLSQAAAEKEIEKIDRDRPDIKNAYELETQKIQRLATGLARGPYKGLTAGRPDLYKAFAWRFLQLLSPSGAFGVVLPRKAVEASGMSDWRCEALTQSKLWDLTALVNNGGWVFDDVHQQYTVILLSLHKGSGGLLRLRGPFRSWLEYEKGRSAAKIEVTATDLIAWSRSAVVPLLASPDHARVFKRIRSYPRLSEQSAGWAPKGLRELNASDDKGFFVFERKKGVWPVYAGESFDLWNPDTGNYYAYAQPKKVTRRLVERQANQIKIRRSAFYGLSREWAQDPRQLPAQYPRIAWRDSSRATDSRTVRVALVPPKTVLVHQAYYLFWREGHPPDEAYTLGVLSSIPFDWYARQLVESHVTVEFMDAAPVPRVAPDDRRRQRVVEIAARLVASDDRFTEWTEAVGVSASSVTSDAERTDLIAELDAVVAHLYGLDEADVRLIFETFHGGWNYSTRLQMVLAHFRK